MEVLNKTILQFDQESPNQKVKYPWIVADYMFNNSLMKERLNNKTLWVVDEKGLVNHSISHSSIIGIVTSMYIIDNKLKINFEIANTFAGNNFKEYIEAGGEIGLHAAGTGNVNIDGIVENYSCDAIVAYKHRLWEE